MMHLWPNRTDCEVYLNDKIDVTELLCYLDAKNASHPDYRTTVFHALVMALARMCKERPLMNRYIQGRRTYERYEVSISFVCKRRFTDNGEESLMVFVPNDEDTLDSLSRKIVGEVCETRASEHTAHGIDRVLDNFTKIPRVLLIPIFKFIRILDFWGCVPKALTDGDPNYTTILASNLGSIQCPSIYHHLSNYGTNSILVTMGTVHKESVLTPDGNSQIRDVVDIGAVLDERIGDGFYFARSLKLVRHVFAHPELLDLPLDEPSNYDYR
ncbi:MAG: hypothetical protein HUJ80_03965 [Firmicutes bacterium]|nr:hypothetical protein [Bacillota bacterium]